MTPCEAVDDPGNAIGYADCGVKNPYSAIRARELRNHGRSFSLVLTRYFELLLMVERILAQDDLHAVDLLELTEQLAERTLQIV